MVKQMYLFKKIGCAVMLGVFLFNCLVGCSTKEVPETMNESNYISTYVMSEQQAKALNPNAYNLQIAIEKGLATQEIYDGDYLKLQAAYAAVVNYYLCAEANLDGYQEFLNTNTYNFAAPSDNVYTKFGSFGRTNICIRNAFYIERLSIDDLNLLRNNTKDSLVCVDNGVLEMVKRTLSQVIIVKHKETDGVFEVVYDAGVFQTNFAPNNALVFVIAYEFDYDENGNLIDRSVEQNKLTFVQAFADMMAAEMEGKLEIPVKVFVN